MQFPERAIEFDDWEALQQAHARLENPSLAARLTNVLGTPVEQGLRMLPPAWHAGISAIAETSIHKALDTAINSLRGDRRLRHPRLHRLLGVTSGAIGGWFGAPALMLELPLSTVIILRAIAHAADSEGEDLDAMEARLACMEVFALGGRSKEDDAAETGYYGMRIALAVHLSNLAQGGAGAASSAAVVKFARVIAHRFGITLSHKAAAQMIPVVGAASGALINGLFVQHFEDVARGHFAVRRLERKYGAQRIETEYRMLSARLVG